MQPMPRGLSGDESLQAEWGPAWIVVRQAAQRSVVPLRGFHLGARAITLGASFGERLDRLGEPSRGAAARKCAATVTVTHVRLWRRSPRIRGGHVEVFER